MANEMLLHCALVAQYGKGLRHNVSIGGVSYTWSSSADFVLGSSGSPESIDELADPTRYGPCVLVIIRKHVASIEQSLVQQLSSWLNTDDVLSTEFVRRVVVVLTQDFQPFEEEAIPSGVQLIHNPWLQNNSCKSVAIYSSSKQMVNIASGPYFRYGGGFHKVSRLYDDFSGAFFSGITQNEELAFEEERPTVHIQVPSRVYSEHISVSLAGLRFGVKDLFAIKGLRTSAGSRSYYDFYPPSPRTAKAVDMLLSQGAILVGKTKNTQFANGEDPQEWIDYTCPWNPRGTTCRRLFFRGSLLTTRWKVTVIKIQILVVAVVLRLCLLMDGSISLWVLIVSVVPTMKPLHY